MVGRLEEVKKSPVGTGIPYPRCSLLVIANNVLLPGNSKNSTPVPIQVPIAQKPACAIERSILASPRHEGLSHEYVGEVIGVENNLGPHKTVVDAQGGEVLVCVRISPRVVVPPKT